MARLAVIQFPGSNCEVETARAANYVGFDVDILRWNASLSVVAGYDAYVLPGGFSYQDRVRAGVISAKLPVMGVIADAACQGKPVLGICNGCQILAEAGLVPDVSGGQQVEVALAPNVRGGKRYGFVCDWVFVTPRLGEKSLFFRYFSEGVVLPIPINHGEGRFVLKEGLDVSDQAAFLYCDSLGEVVDAVPVNPNGASLNLAGLTNRLGNVLAIMPHPERAFFAKQIPVSIESDWAMKKFSETEGPWVPLFRGMRDAV